MKLFCKCYSTEFEANTLPEAKRKASQIANRHHKSIDVLHVVEVEGGTAATFLRINKICPNNTIERGAWA